MPRGGWRPNAGRKAKAEEEKIVAVAMNAVIKKYGSLEEGFIALLESGEPSLIKFVFEHVAGKPRERIDMTMEGEINAVQLIRLPDNGRDEIEEAQVINN
jgi:hypothetical protein